MQKIVALSIGLMCASFHAHSNQNGLIDLAIEQLKQSGELTGFSKCLKISESDLLKHYKAAMAECNRKISFEREEAFTQCFEKTLPRLTERSAEELNHCEPPVSEQQQKMDQLEKQLVELEQKIEMLFQKENLSMEEQKQLETLEEKMAILSEKQIKLSEGLYQAMGEPLSHEDAINKVSAMTFSMGASQSDLAHITLPIYTNSEVMMHLSEGLKMGQVQALPAATFQSNDSIDSIVQFYKKKLPQFTLKQLTENEFIFMESMPENFNILSHMEAYSTTPHVLIKLAETSVGQPKNKSTLIEIAYRR